MYKYLLPLTLFVLPCAHAQTTWNSSQEALEWINSKIGTVKQDGRTYYQSLEADLSKSSVCRLKMNIDEAGVLAVAPIYQFYFENLDYTTMAAAISGKTLTLDIGTENNLKLIREEKNGANAGFTNKMQIYFDDLQMARNAVEAFKYIRSNPVPGMPYFAAKEEAHAWLGTHVGKAVFGYTEMEQTLAVFPEQNNKFVLNVNEKDSKGTVKRAYEFYLSDFSTGQIRVNASNWRIWVSFVSSGDLKPVKWFVDGVQQNYTNKFDIYTDDSQNAFNIRAAFLYLITGKQDVSEQQGKESFGESIKGLFVKKEASDPGKTGDGKEGQTDTQKVIEPALWEQSSFDPFGKIGQEKIENPDYDNVPMWYDFAGKALKNLERKKYDSEARSTGMYSSENLIFFEGLSSPVIFTANTTPLFVVKLASVGTDPYSVVKLNVATLNSNKKRREFIMGVHKVGRSTIKENIIELAIEKKEAGIYFVKPLRPLLAGEYFFMFEGNNQVFTFSVR